MKKLLVLLLFCLTLSVNASGILQLTRDFIPIDTIDSVELVGKNSIYIYSQGKASYRRLSYLDPKERDKDYMTLLQFIAKHRNED